MDQAKVNEIVHDAMTETLEEVGTSEGASKGWKTRKGHGLGDASATSHLRRVGRYLDDKERAARGKKRKYHGPGARQRFQIRQKASDKKIKGKADLTVPAGFEDLTFWKKG
jgi:hypothetical protein